MRYPCLNKRYKVQCSTCQMFREVSYIRYHHIKARGSNECRSCVSKKLGFQKGHKQGLRFGAGQSEYRGEYTRERALKSSVKIRSCYKGSNHWNWQGGITSKNKRVRNSTVYKNWRVAVFERDDYTCQNCGERGGKLNADHIKPFSLYPNLRLDLDNGRTLCEDCHSEIGWSFFKETNPRTQYDVSDKVTSIVRT